MMGSKKATGLEIVELPFGIDVPEAVANMMLPSPELVTYYRNLEKRILWLDSDVTVDWLEYERLIIQWNAEDHHYEPELRRPIRLMFYSNGGDLEVNYSFINLIKMSKTPIIGVNMGIANSAGCYIFMACHERFAMPGAQFLIHQGSASGMNGTYSQIAAYMDDYNRKMETLHKYILEHTSIDADMLAEKLRGEWFVRAEEAVELGLCDKIVDDICDLYSWE